MHVGRVYVTSKCKPLFTRGIMVSMDKDEFQEMVRVWLVDGGDPKTLAEECEVSVSMVGRWARSASAPSMRVRGFVKKRIFEIRKRTPRKFELCDCLCHTQDGYKHAVKCCFVCTWCQIRIKRLASKFHESRCHARKEELDRAVENRRETD